MLLGKIFGKVTTTDFKFHVEHETRKFDYVQVYHGAYDYVLCQVIELEKQDEMTTAICQIIGYKDKDGKIKQLRIPFEPGSEVLSAEDEFITAVIKLESSEKGAYIGKLEGRDIPVELDLKKLLTKHVAVLAKSGSGKSYTVGVLLEEIMEKNVPLLIIDPHGEYSSMKYPNDNEEEQAAMPYFDVKPRGYTINEYGDTAINRDVRPLRLPANLSSQELIDLLPMKLSASQLGVMYSATQSLSSCDFDSVMYSLQEEESNAKWSIISALEQLRDKNIFSSAPTPYHELVKSGGCSVINLKGIDPELQDIIVYKLAKDLFELRKQEKLPPFFLVIEEAHNYCPERSFGERKASKILRNIASEGRKFGLGFCVISQRPARIDKSVVSQCSTQIIMKVTNPNDLKAISNSVEGITNTTEKEIQNLSIGTALVTGLTDVPLFVRVRPRKTRHGGHAIDILNSGTNSNQGTTNQQVEMQNNTSNTSHQVNGVQQETENDENIIDKITAFEEQEILPLIKPTLSVKDVMLMSEQPVLEVQLVLVPVFILSCTDGEEQFNILVNRTNGAIITNKDEFTNKYLPELEKLDKKELRILQFAYNKKQFNTIDLVHEIGSNLDVNQEITKLITQQYLIKITENDFALNKQYIFNKLQNYKSFDTPHYEHIDYHEKLEAQYSIDDVLLYIQKFTNVRDHAESYLITYHVINQEGKEE
ncbi:ATP-binding protein [Candidatus Woesearchaeota archaeon]|nr:ATP-binding protein [Candidatus Woesearchaeota archaeon]